MCGGGRELRIVPLTPGCPPAQLLLPLPAASGTLSPGRRVAGNGLFVPQLIPCLDLRVLRTGSCEPAEPALHRDGRAESEPQRSCAAQGTARKRECAPTESCGHHQLLPVGTQQIQGFRKRCSTSLSVNYTLDVISD